MKTPWNLEFRASKPSPYCGRIDDHEPHPWKGIHGWHDCPGPPITEMSNSKRSGA